MSYSFYNFLHLLGLILVLPGYGALLARAVLAPENRPLRIWGAVLGGVGLLLLLVAGFGMQAKGDWGWPLWILLKIGTWGLLGASLTLIDKKPGLNWFAWIAVIGISALSAWLGIFGKTTPALN
ncbi:MAG: hypothetical protein ACLFRP_03340 [Puniceicoccaceae bacterium]